jgi:hypothetical protein
MYKKEGEININNSGIIYMSSILLDVNDIKLSCYTYMQFRINLLLIKLKELIGKAKI